MKPTGGILIAVVVAAGSAFTGAHSSREASFTTVAVTALAIEGLTGDDDGALYTTGRAPLPGRCPVWRIDTDAAPPVVPVQIGSIPNAAPGCNPSGITRDAGNFYIADANQGGAIWQDVNGTPPAEPFARGPGVMPVQ